jgi:hypothetical protein
MDIFVKELGVYIGKTMAVLWGFTFLMQQQKRRKSVKSRHFV